MRKLSVQFRAVTPVLLLSWLGILISLLLAVFTSTVKNIPLDTFTKDPLSVSNAPFYFGFFSNLGIMFWSASIMTCWFVAYRVFYSGTKNDFQFMLWSGIVTLVMTIDDLFQLHEQVMPAYFAVSENMVYITYLNIYLIYFIRFRKKILRSEFITLILSFIFLGLSTVIDLLPLPIPKDTFLEDALKLFGTVSWFVYYFRTSNEVLDRKLPTAIY